MSGRVYSSSLQTPVGGTLTPLTNLTGSEPTSGRCTAPPSRSLNPTSEYCSTRYQGNCGPGGQLDRLHPAIMPARWRHFHTHALPTPTATPTGKVLTALDCRDELRSPGLVEAERGPKEWWEHVPAALRTS